MSTSIISVKLDKSTLAKSLLLLKVPLDPLCPGSPHPCLRPFLVHTLWNWHWWSEQKLEQTTIHATSVSYSAHSLPLDVPIQKPMDWQLPLSHCVLVDFNSFGGTGFLHIKNWLCTSLLSDISILWVCYVHCLDLCHLQWRYALITVVNLYASIY